VGRAGHRSGRVLSTCGGRWPSLRRLPERYKHPWEQGEAAAEMVPGGRRELSSSQSRGSAGQGSVDVDTAAEGRGALVRAVCGLG